MNEVVAKGPAFVILYRVIRQGIALTRCSLGLGRRSDWQCLLVATSLCVGTFAATAAGAALFAFATSVLAATTSFATSLRVWGRTLALELWIMLSKLAVIWVTTPIGHEVESALCFVLGVCCGQSLLVVSAAGAP